jgi:hypothetical protein
VCGERRACKTPQDRQKRQKGNKKGKRGENQLRVFIVIFQIMAIVGESSQKYNKKGGKIRHDVALTWRFKKMTKAKDKTFVAMWKKTKVFNKSSHFSLHFCRC